MSGIRYKGMGCRGQVCEIARRDIAPAGAPGLIDSPAQLSNRRFGCGCSQQSRTESEAPRGIGLSCDDPGVLESPVLSVAVSIA
jgi:hypothetical protein